MWKKKNSKNKQTHDFKFCAHKNRNYILYKCRLIYFSFNYENVEPGNRG
jgi:hypothetical protein